MIKEKRLYNAQGEADGTLSSIPRLLTRLNRKKKTVQRSRGSRRYPLEDTTTSHPDEQEEKDFTTLKGKPDGTLSVIPRLLTRLNRKKKTVQSRGSPRTSSRGYPRLPT